MSLKNFLIFSNTEIFTSTFSNPHVSVKFSALSKNLNQLFELNSAAIS
ncbi:PTS system, sorbose-specific IID component [Lacticaseibacillus paracasei subsp. tolerans Lpl7]|nr:PTS system, sorbose-specific IID component [Lacticaseibacillus paracasei subsp. tolerans Lpl7]